MEDISMSLFAVEADGALVESVTVEELEQFTDFDDLWETLGRKSLTWQSFRDQPGFMTEDGPEYIVELADQARSENHLQRNAALAAIRRLYRSETHRQRVIEHLQHPLRGYWAMNLLMQEPRGADLLRAFSFGELACMRAARVASGSDLAGEAATHMCVALQAGLFSPPPEPEKPYFRAKEPMWPVLVYELGRLESLLKLLHRETPEWVIMTVLSFIEKNRSYLVKSATDAECTRTAAWARSVAEADVRPWTLAVQLLSMVGSRDDARRWRSRLSQESLPEAVAEAALELIGKLGNSSYLPMLRTLAESTEREPLLVAALCAVAELGGSDEANWMFGLLKAPPPGTRRMQERVEAWEQWDALTSARRRTTKERSLAYGSTEAGRPDFPRPMSWDLDRWRRPCYRTIVRFGDSKQALTIARMLVDDGSAVRLLQEHGRLPEHALLVLGALRHAPADHVIPYQITGGGDEVVTDDTALRVSGLVGAFALEVGVEEVRRAFLRAAFWNPRDEDAAIEIVDSLGGTKLGDATLLMEQLEADPTLPLALRLLSLIGGNEAAIITRWRRSASPCWSDQDAPSESCSTRPLRQLLRQALIDRFVEEPGALRRFVSESFGKELAAQMPGEHASLDQVIFDLIDSLERRGRLHELEDAIDSHR